LKAPELEGFAEVFTAFEAGDGAEASGHAGDPAGREAWLDRSFVEPVRVSDGQAEDREHVRRQPQLRGNIERAVPDRVRYELSAIVTPER
jgi:hypothetical protein